MNLTLHPDVTGSKTSEKSVLKNSNTFVHVLVEAQIQVCSSESSQARCGPPTWLNVAHQSLLYMYGLK